MPNITDLQISLFSEDDVDFIMTHMPQLNFLNNLPVDRDEEVDNSEELPSEEQESQIPNESHSIHITHQVRQQISEDCRDND